MDRKRKCLLAIVNDKDIQIPDVLCDIQKKHLFQPFILFSCDEIFSFFINHIVV